MNHGATRTQTQGGQSHISGGIWGGRRPGWRIAVQAAGSAACPCPLGKNGVQFREVRRHLRPDRGDRANRRRRDDAYEQAVLDQVLARLFCCETNDKCLHPISPWVRRVAHRLRRCRCSVVRAWVEQRGCRYPIFESSVISPYGVNSYGGSINFVMDGGRSVLGLSGDFSLFSGDCARDGGATLTCVGTDFVRDRDPWLALDSYTHVFAENPIEKWIFKSATTRVWRYLELASLVRLLMSKKLLLTRVDLLKDDFEGSVTRGPYEHWAKDPSKAARFARAPRN